MVMRLLAIWTMHYIPMLFLYNTLHLYYTPVGLLARLLILLPYIDPVYQLRWLLSLSLLTSSSSCTAATLTDWIVFLFLLRSAPASCFILFLNSISNLCPSLNSRDPDAPLHVANNCIAPFPHSSKAYILLSWFCVLCLGWFNIAWDGALTLLHIYHELLPWFPVILEKQHPKSFLSDWQ